MNINRMGSDEQVLIQYGIFDTPFGKILMGNTERGICYLGISESLDELTQRYPQAEFQAGLKGYYEDFWVGSDLHVQASDFQFRVWKALLDIPKGQTSTYAKIAQAVGSPRAYRAVGTAIGQNPVSILIPCHRVLRSDGTLGGYYWGVDYKRSILDAENP